ncbi:hypothetical protein ABKN59_008056 [Abortiporus biennis]
MSDSLSLTLLNISQTEMKLPFASRLFLAVNSVPLVACLSLKSSAAKRDVAITPPPVGCFERCDHIQDGFGDFGLDLNAPNPGFTFTYAIIAFPNGACDYVSSEDPPPPTGNPNTLNSLVNSAQPNCLSTFTEVNNKPIDKFNDTGSFVGSGTGYTCKFPRGQCTWNERGDLIFESQGEVKNKWHLYIRTFLGTMMIISFDFEVFKFGITKGEGALFGSYTIVQKNPKFKLRIRVERIKSLLKPLLRRDMLVRLLSLPMINCFSFKLLSMPVGPTTPTSKLPAIFAEYEHASSIVAL